MKKTLLYYRLIGKFNNIGIIWDEIAPSEENAIVFAHENINPEPKRFIEDNRFSLEYCLAHFGTNINDRYRKDRPDKIDLEIADMIATHTTKIPLVFYRGVSKPVFQQMRKNAKNIKGVDLYEKSFLQTSLVKGHENNTRYHLRIYAPEGTHAVYLGNVNNEQNSYEVVLQHGSKLKIISIDDRYINCRLLDF